MSHAAPGSQNSSAAHFLRNWKLACGGTFGAPRLRADELSAPATLSCAHAVRVSVSVRCFADAWLRKPSSPVVDASRHEACSVWGKCAVLQHCVLWCHGARGLQLGVFAHEQPAFMSSECILVQACGIFLEVRQVVLHAICSDTAVGGVMPSRLSPKEWNGICLHTCFRAAQAACCAAMCGLMLWLPVLHVH